MELRAFAEQILFATTLEEKLGSPPVITDARPGPPLNVPAAPGRPAHLQLKSPGAVKADFPGVHRLERAEDRGRLLHFFANHELLATELMALALLRFPNAPAAFRRGLLQTLKDEQRHTRLYLRRMQDCGIQFGALPLSGYFWRAISAMESPMDYLAGLSLTFEQANLDFCLYFARGFHLVGDEKTARLLEGIYRDEIGHVAYGLKWFRRWKDPKHTDWEAFCRQLKFPLSPSRAKGMILNVAGRRAAGFDPVFVDELNVHAQSKGRTPTVFLFNPLAEGRIARGRAFTPVRHQSLLARDLANLPQFLGRQDDIVLLEKRPSVQFLSGIKQAGFALPEFVELKSGRIDRTCALAERKIGRLRPWAWGPDSLELLAPLFDHVTGEHGLPTQRFNPEIARLYSKVWSAGFLREFLEQWGPAPWLCPAADSGVAVETLPDALEAIAAIRRRGHPRVVVKQAIGLAGHNALRLWEPTVLENQRRWLARALEHGRQVVVEPWLTRELDFSIQLEMETDGLKPVGYTGLITDQRGQFQGNWAAANHHHRIPPRAMALLRGQDQGDAPPQVQRLYHELFGRLEEKLRRAGFLGPVGIDAFICRVAPGHCRLKPIVEINPRCTMGRLTVELMKRACPGSCGVFRLINLAQVRARGFADFAHYAQALGQSAPLRLEGEPVPRIRAGVLALNDPVQARVCLATFAVGDSLEQLAC